MEIFFKLIFLIKKKHIFFIFILETNKDVCKLFSKTLFKEQKKKQKTHLGK